MTVAKEMLQLSRLPPDSVPAELPASILHISYLAAEVRINDIAFISQPYGSFSALLLQQSIVHISTIVSLVQL